MDISGYYLKQLLQVTYSRKKIEVILKDLPNLFGIEDDISVVG